MIDNNKSCPTSRTDDARYNNELMPACDNFGCLLMGRLRSQDDISIGTVLLASTSDARVNVASSVGTDSSLTVWTRRCGDASGRLLKEVFSPSQTHNNIKLLGSKEAVKIEKERSKKGYIIHPLSNFRQFWDLLILVVMSVNLFVLPLDIAFFTDTTDHFLAISDLMCILDIIFNFRTGYRAFPELTSFELDGRNIARHYLKTWFVVDLVGSLPLHHIIMRLCGNHESVSLGLKSASHALKYMRVVKLVRLLKLLRLSRIIRVVLIYEEVYRLTTAFMRYIKLLSMMMMLAHWNGCIQFLIPMLQDFPKDSWVALCKIQDEQWYVQYRWALFKTLSHMLCIGYGRFVPILLSEASITIFTMVTGATFYALFIVTSMSYVIKADYSKKSCMEKIQQTKEYLSHHRIPDHLKERAESYLNQKYYHGRYFDEDALLSNISKTIRDDIIGYTCQDVIVNIPFFKAAPAETVSDILRIVTSDVYLAGDIITHQGMVASKLFFVRDGEVEVIINDKIIERLTSGDYFGEINTLIPGKKGLFTAKAITACNIVILSDEFKLILEENESIRSLLEHAAIARILRMYYQCELSDILEEEVVIRRPDGRAYYPSATTLSQLFEIYFEGLLDRVEENLEKEKSITPLKVNARNIDKLIVLLAQSHGKMHESCNISAKIRRMSSPEG